MDQLVLLLPITVLVRNNLYFTKYASFLHFYLIHHCVFSLRFVNIYDKNQFVSSCQEMDVILTFTFHTNMFY